MKPVKMKMIAANHTRRKLGQATVEFAFLIPVLLAVIFGIAFFSMMFYSYLTLQLAVREGTNAIADNPDTETGPMIRSLVQSKTFTTDPNQVQVDVVPWWDPNDPNPQYHTDPWTQGVRVSATATYTVPLPVLSIPIFGGGNIGFAPIQMQAKSVMTVN